MDIKIEESWKQRLADEFEKPYFAELTRFVREEYGRGRCYPPGSQIFNAFNLCPFDRVKVVIIGQDPYHEPGQAEGLCFSVADGVPAPPSLQNIFKEIGHGWETFTDAVIARLSAERDHLVFILWGSYAQRKGAVIDRQRHLVLQSAHPSPLSAHRGFFGNHHFSLTNDYLTQHGQQPINW